MRVLVCAGLGGQTPFLTYHGGRCGCFKVTVKARTGEGAATIWEAKDNHDMEDYELDLDKCDGVEPIEVRGVGWGRLVGGGGWS